MWNMATLDQEDSQQSQLLLIVWDGNLLEKRETRIMRNIKEENPEGERYRFPGYSQQPETGVSN